MILCSAEFTFHYAVKVSHLQLSDCKQLECTLTLFEQFILTAIGAAKFESCRGLLTEEEFRMLIDEQVFWPTEPSLVNNVKKNLDPKMRQKKREKEIKKAARAILD